MSRNKMGKQINNNRINFHKVKRSLLKYFGVFLIISISGCSSNLDVEVTPITTVTEVPQTYPVQPLEPTREEEEETIADTDQEQVDPILNGESEAPTPSEAPKSYDYTGYLDSNPRFAQENPKRDYDGDGLEDRVYKEYEEEHGNSTFTLEFGNGTRLQLSDYNVGIFYKTESADLTGDGINEILFEQMGIGTGGNYLFLSIFIKEGESYVRMDNPYEEIDPTLPNVGGMFGIPIMMTKVNDTTLQLYQPDHGYEGTIITQKITEADGSVFDEMEHLYYPDMEGKNSIYGVSSLELVEEASNRTSLLFQSKLGDKWIIYYINWKLEYIDQEWKITDVYQPTPIP